MLLFLWTFFFLHLECWAGVGSGASSFLRAPLCEVKEKKCIEAEPVKEQSGESEEGGVNMAQKAYTAAADAAAGAAAAMWKLARYSQIIFFSENRSRVSL